MKKYETRYLCECFNNLDGHKMDTLSEDEWEDVKRYWIGKGIGYVVLPNHAVNIDHYIIEKTDKYWITTEKEDEDTMKNVYIIRTDIGTLRVLFTDSIVDNAGINQRVTVCGIREGETSKDKAYWGNTIQNPRDADNPSRGRQVAFRHAFVSALQARGFKIKDDGSNLNQYPALNKLYDDLRTKLYEAKAW